MPPPHGVITTFERPTTASALNGKSYNQYTINSMKRVFILGLVALSISSSGAANPQKQKADTLVITTAPQMHCANCENKIKQNIRFVKGVKRIETSVPKQEVTIVYQGEKATYEDFEKAFARIGYKIQRKRKSL